MNRYSVNDPGHSYVLPNVDNGTQPLLFIRKKPTTEGKGNTPLMTAQDGTTTEAVIEVLIDRLEYLNTIMASEHNRSAIEHLQSAKSALENRTDDRKERGVEGTYAE